MSRGELAEVNKTDLILIERAIAAADAKKDKESADAFREIRRKLLEQPLSRLSSDEYKQAWLAVAPR